MRYKKNEVFSGVVWSAIDKLGLVLVQLILEVVMARLLLPSDYGAIAMVAIFLAIGQVFIDGGFSNALIQKQDRSEIDFSTVFYFNIAVSLVIYLFLYIIAPYISIFYNLNILTNVIRVISLSILLNSLILIHRTKLNISLDFKTQAKFSLLAVSLSGVIGLILAYFDYGVWALVYQYLFLSFFNVVFFWIRYRWVPLLIFSKKSFQELFYFGSKLLAASLIQVIYNNSYAILIGKKLSAKDLGIYSKASQFTLMPVSVFTSTLQRVAFPYLTSYQNDDKKLFELNMRYTKIIALALFPVFFTISILAEPIVKIVLSDTWIEVVPILRILSITYIFYPIIVNNMFLFQVKNKTNIFLKIEILTKITGILILLITFKFGIVIMSLGLLFQQTIQLIITSILANRLLGGKSFSQLKIIYPYLILSSITFISVYWVINLVENSFNQLGIGILLILLSYTVYYTLFNKNEISFLLKSFKK